MFSESDLLPISALHHLVFCERQWALIHLEQQWAENRLTAEGRVMHERTHREESESRHDLRIVRGLRISSMRLGLVGMADVVEFMREEKEVEAASPNRTTAIRLEGVGGWWRPAPVEYKHGKPKPDRSDEVQLCAQALCIEEMLGVAIPGGAIFYGRPRRRTQIAFDAPLRLETTTLTTRLHELHLAEKTPPPVYSKKCLNCSLLDICRPKATGSRKAAGLYVANSLRDLEIASSRDQGGK